MAKSGGVVAPESLSGSGGRNAVDAVDGRIAEKWFVREKNGLAKHLETTGVGN